MVVFFIHRKEVANLTLFHGFVSFSRQSFADPLLLGGVQVLRRAASVTMPAGGGQHDPQSQTRNLLGREGALAGAGSGRRVAATGTASAVGRARVLARTGPRASQIDDGHGPLRIVPVHPAISQVRICRNTKWPRWLHIGTYPFSFYLFMTYFRLSACRFSMNQIAMATQ